MLALDGSENKNNLGANAILGVSMAACKAGAAHKGNFSQVTSRLNFCRPVQTTTYARHLSLKKLLKFQGRAQKYSENSFPSFWNWPLKKPNFLFLQIKNWIETTVLNLSLSTRLKMLNYSILFVASVECYHLRLGLMIIKNIVGWYT